MSSSSLDKELEEQLIDAGNKLLDPPSDVDKLLPLLDKAESYLTSVVQSPIATLQSALSPYLKALVADKLLRHSDTDVKVAVAACISEITRITAPDAPFDDEHMKGAFQLIVSSFEHLDDKSSRSYVKRTTILETLAKVRSCVVMLDLECDALILEMFQHFLKGVRDYHPEHVFSLMETIMALVIEESEDISTELLSPILACLKKDNEGVLPIAKQLAEKVLESSAPKLKPYLGQVLESLGTKVDDYSKAVGLVFLDDGGEKKSDAHEEAGYEGDKVAASISVVSNGARPVEEGSMVDSDSLKKQDNPPRISRLKITGLSSINKLDKSSDNIESKKVGRSSKSGKKRGKKRSTLASVPADSAPIDDPEKPFVDNQRDCINDRPSSPHKDKSVVAELPAEGEVAEVDLSSPKATSNESLDVASPSKTGNTDEIPQKKSRRPKKKQGLMKGSEGDSGSEAKANVQIGKKTGGGASNEDRTPLKVKLSKKGAHPISDADNKSSELSRKKIDETPVVEDDTKVKSQKQSSKMIDASTAAIKDGMSLKSAKDKKGNTKGKGGPKKEMTESSKNDNDQKKSSSKSKKNPQTEVQHETPKTSSKRKRAPEKEASHDKVYGEELVGKRIKVWWPQDRKFYEGTVDSFDSKKVKHTVKYDDGDEEILNLRKQRWEFVQGGSAPNEEKEVSPEDSDSDSIETKLPLNKYLKMKFGKSGKSLAKRSGSLSAKSKASSATPDPKSQDTNMEKESSSSKSKDETPNIGSKIVGLALRMTKKTKGGKTKEEAERTPSSKSKKGKSKEGRDSGVKKSSKKKGGSGGKKVKKANGCEKVKASESDSERTESVEGSEKVVEIAAKKRKKLDSMTSPGMVSKKRKKS